MFSHLSTHTQSHFKEQSPSREANSSTASEENPRRFVDPQRFITAFKEVRHPLYLILSQINPAHAPARLYPF